MGMDQGWFMLTMADSLQVCKVSREIPTPDVLWSDVSRTKVSGIVSRLSITGFW